MENKATDRVNGMVQSRDRKNIGKMYKTKRNLKTTLKPKKKKKAPPPKKKPPPKSQDHSEHIRVGVSRGKLVDPEKWSTRLIKLPSKSVALASRQPKLFSKHLVHTALGLSHFLVRTQNLASSLI